MPVHPRPDATCLPHPIMKAGYRLAVVGALVIVSACRIDWATPAIAPQALDRGLPPASTVISAENGASGTRTWYSPPSAWSADSDLAIWAAPYSVRAGDTLDVFAHARYAPLRIEVFRLGYYGGAGGRRKFTADSVKAGLQPPCGQATNGITNCPWARTLTIATDSNWRSGIYLAKATDRRGKTWSYPFVLRDERQAAILVIVPQFTWQAYNTFGGTSLYTTGADGRLGTSVSFERPYKIRGGGGYSYGQGYSNDVAVSRWLEKRGDDVTYISDADLVGPLRDFPTPSRAVVIAGHAEYWTWNEYSFVKSFRDGGVHLMFMSGNNAYWDVRTTAGEVTQRPNEVVYCYKQGGDPYTGGNEQLTGLFRSDIHGRPENALYGIMHFHHGYGNYPLVVSDSAVGEHASAFLAAAGLAPGDTLANILTLGTGSTQFMSIEGDRIAANGQTPAGLEVLFHADINSTAGTVERYHTTFFVSRSGAGVFASGFNEWGRWLDDWFAPGDARIQHVSDAVLDWMLAH